MALALAPTRPELIIPGVTFNPADTAYFLGRRTVLPTHDPRLRRLRDLLFIALNRDSADPGEVFAILPQAGRWRWAWGWRCEGRLALAFRGAEP